DDSNAPRTPLATASPIKGRLLLVEDNPVNLLVAQRLISLTGMQCDTAENGEQALEKLARGHYDIVLMDCQMPVMDGYTATRKWREHEEESQLQPMPIIAMTANAMAGDRQKCLDAGMDDYLSKPVAREHLENTLRRWLDGPSRSRRGLAQTTQTTTAPALEPTAMPASFAATAPVQTAAMAAPTEATKPIAPPPAQHAVPALDSEIIEELWSAMGDQFKQLVDVFLDDAPGHLTKLEAAAVVGDIAGMAGPAHALKSSSANLGALQVSAAAKHIEHGARDRTLADAVGAVAALSHEYHRAEIELRVLLH
ncbi:MAG TPA: response regulator, partial [Xanthomonadaceae bacterium]|nr:response regulator [Xanthomonadaceae bacterium]